MRITSAALAASALVGRVLASHHHEHRHGHHAWQKRSEASSSTDDSCGCTTYVTTITRPKSVMPEMESTVTLQSTVSLLPELSTSSQEIPTAFVTVCPTPGTYTIPAETKTYDATTVVPVPTSTNIPPGTHTIGGVTTIVSTATTVVCPYVSLETSESTTTSKIYTTTYVCPSSGTYTIAPITTAVSESTAVVYPVPATFTPGTYTHPETTVTITRTSEVVVCPYTPESTPSSSSVPESSVAPSAPEQQYEDKQVAPSAEPSAPAQIEASEESHVEEQSAAPAAEAAPTETPEAEYVESSTSATEEHASTSSSAASSATPESSASPSGSVGGGDHWAMTYSPYADDGQCKTQSQVASDIADIAQKGFNSIRLYGTDCGGLEHAGSACQEHGLKMVAGVFIDGKGLPGAHEQIEDLVSWGQWSIVELIVVGNEAMFNGHLSASDLASLISEAKDKFRAAGYGGPVTTTEASVKLLEDNADTLCPVLDVVAANIHPFFNPDTAAADAGDFVRTHMEGLAKVCPGKEAYNLETGWPKGGQANGLAVPGEAEQKMAIEAIKAAAPGRVVFFSYIDDLWKKPGDLGVEQHYGCGQLF